MLLGYYVVLVTQAEDVGHVVVGALIGGVTEAEHHVDLVIGDARGDLLSAAVLEGEEAVDGKPRRFGDELSGARGGAQRVLGKNPAVGGAELNHQLFLVVVGDQCNVHEVKSPFRIRFSSAVCGCR